VIFSEFAQGHISRPRNRGEMDGADRYGFAGEPGGGPYVQIWLKVDQERIVQARYETNGCPSSIACSSILCELAIGRSVAKMRLIEPAELALIAGGLPEGKEHYADLAVRALRDCVKEED
jgi:nitrogen fixation NifU-like protein